MLSYTPAWEFQEKAKKAGIRPIIGMEAYVAPGDRRARERVSTGRGKPYYHLVLLARDAVGYRNLVKLSSLAYTEGFYSKPRVDRELLAKYNEGIIVSSACMAGEIASNLLSDNFDAAREAAAWYADVFKDRYYLEVQAHHSENQDDLNRRVFQLAEEVGLPVVATNDAHFLRREDHDSHDILLCIGLGKDWTDTNRMRYDEGLYFKNADEIRSSFPGRADVMENTLKIGEEAGVSLSKQYRVPSFPLPADVASENDYLVQLAEAGARERYGDPLPANVRERLDYELAVITGTGYAGYFLIVADFIKAARDKGIPVGPGRGSAAGSLVAYSLRITDVCPLKFDLLFERFLNPERVSMPDIDVDFCFERRGEVIEYVRQKYGRDSVGQIITFGTLKSRAAIKDVGRTLGFTPSETDWLAKLIPNQPNFFAYREGSDRADSRGERALQHSERRLHRNEREEDPLQAAPRLRHQARRTLAPRRSARRRHRHRPGTARRLRPHLHRSVERRRRECIRRRIDRRHPVRHERARESGNAEDGFSRAHHSYRRHRRDRRNQGAHRRIARSRQSSSRRSGDIPAAARREKPPASFSSSPRSPPTCCARCAPTDSTILSRRTR